MRVHLVSPGADGRRDQGAVAIIVAIMAILIMALAAFALDIGNAYAQKRQLSVAADAASLAAAAKVGEAIPPGQPCTASLLSSLNDGKGHVGAQAIAQAAADATNTANSRQGNVGTITVDPPTCEKNKATDPAPNAVQVVVSNTRAVKTFLAGAIGIGTSNPVATATARYYRAPTSGGLRPWAVCDDTVQAAQNAPDQTFWTGIDKMPKVGVGPCGTSAAGNWGAVDFNGGGNSAGDLADWTLNGYPNPVDIPSTIPADPGVSNKSELRTAFQKLIGTVALFPSVTGFSSGSGNGNNATFDAIGIATLRVCGIVYGNNTYNIDQATGQVSDCWVTPSQGSGTANPPTVLPVTKGTTVTTGNGANKSTTLAISNPLFDCTQPVSWYSVKITGAAKQGNKVTDLTTGISACTDSTHVTLSTAAAQDVTNVDVTVTVTTVTYSGGFGPFDAKGNVLNHIQFRWVNYSTESYSGSSGSTVTCAFNDRNCVGGATLWR